MDVKKGLWQSIGLSGCLLLAACGAGGDGSSASAVADAGTGSASASCSNPLPVQAVDVEITVNVPQDFDPLFNPAPTTEVFFSVLLPARCPADRFPVVLHSHGYGGSRFTQAAADGTLYPADTGFKSMDEMVPALPYHGYIVISFDERGHGQSQPQNGGGYARMIDPAAETQDARAILDWAFDHADQYAIQTETNSGIAKDIRVGTVGYSYGGAFQLPLAALDARIDAIVPDSTWHSLPNALMPEDAVKQSWLQILGIFAQTPSAGAQVGTINTPMMQSALGVAGIGDPDRA
jgi:ABC-2 type transport system ATP-binding protein